MRDEPKDADAHTLLLRALTELPPYSQRMKPADLIAQHKMMLPSKKRVKLFELLQKLVWQNPET